MYLNCNFLDQFLFELSCKTHTETNTDSDEYSIVALEKHNYNDNIICLEAPKRKNVPMNTSFPIPIKLEGDPLTLSIAF